MKKINHSARINKEGVIILEGWDDKVDKFCEKNQGKRAEITLEVVSNVGYYIHKYYRGALLPDITAAAGEVSQEKVHFELKREFLGKKCTSIDDIPKRYLGNCQFLINNGKLIGYVPSMRAITHEEAKQYLKDCENRLFIDLGSHIGASVSNKDLIHHQNNAKEMKEEIYKNRK